MLNLFKKRKEFWNKYIGDEDPRLIPYDDLLFIIKSNEKTFLATGYIRCGKDIPPLIYGLKDISFEIIAWRRQCDLLSIK